MASFTLRSPRGNSGWNAETVKAYFRDPDVEWFAKGEPVNGGPIDEEGFYILLFCRNPDCCRPQGPFKTAEDARQWSQANLVEHGQN